MIVYNTFPLYYIQSVPEINTQFNNIYKLDVDFSFFVNHNATISTFFPQNATPYLITSVTPASRSPVSYFLSSICCKAFFQRFQCISPYLTLRISSLISSNDMPCGKFFSDCARRDRNACIAFSLVISQFAPFKCILSKIFIYSFQKPCFFVLPALNYLPNSKRIFSADCPRPTWRIIRST